MKKLFTILAAVVVAASCQSGGAQSIEDAADGTKAPAEQALEEEQPSDETLCGGYTEQREMTEEEYHMFNRLTDGLEVYYKPLSVSTQVVAGINYKFWCRYEDSAKETSGHCWVIIYKSLQDEPSITSIEYTD